MSLHRTLAHSHPKLLRGRVWCHVCGNHEDVDAERALRSGWPVCHNETMSLDSPNERALQDAFAGIEITPAQARTLDWLASWERDTVNNIVAIVLKARKAGVVRKGGES